MGEIFWNVGPVAGSAYGVISSLFFHMYPVVAISGHTMILAPFLHACVISAQSCVRAVSGVPFGGLYCMAANKVNIRKEGDMRKSLLFCFLLCVTFLFIFGRILQDTEMHISIQKGDWLLILPLDAEIGDSVLIEDPFDPEKNHVRRLIATEDMEVVYERNGSLIRDGKRITQQDMGNIENSRVIEETEWGERGEPRKRYIYRRQDPILISFPKERVALEHVYVLGDNRDSALDSRYWGSIPKDHIIGVVCLRIGASTPWSGWLTWYP